MEHLRLRRSGSKWTPEGALMQRGSEPQAPWPRKDRAGWAWEKQTGALPSAATRGHWFPRLELQAASAFRACPSPSRASAAKTLSPLSSEANTDPGGEKRTPRRASSIPWQWKAGAGPGLRPWVFALAGNEPTAQHLCYFSSQRNSPRERHPSQVAWEAGGHSALSFSVLESDWAGSPQITFIQNPKHTVQTFQSVVLTLTHSKLRTFFNPN